MEQDPNIPTQGEEEPESPGRTVRRDISRSVSVLESLLLVSSQPLPFDRIGQLLGGLSKQEVREVVEAVQSKYSATGSGILVEEVAKGLQLRTNPANQEFVRKLFETKPQRFSRPSLETLAVVAYRQPVTRQEIEQVRGVDCAASLKTLMERRLVKVVGKKDVPGRPFLFGTTREFLEVFSLASLSELPSMHDIEDFLAARTGTPVPPAPGAPQLFSAFGDQPGAGEELAAGLEETEHGELFMATPDVLPEGVSDDVMVDPPSRTEAADTGIKPLTPAGKGFSKFASSGEQFSSDPAEPLVTSRSDLPKVGNDEGDDQPEE